ATPPRRVRPVRRGTRSVVRGRAGVLWGRAAADRVHPRHRDEARGRVLPHGRGGLRRPRRAGPPPDEVPGRDPGPPAPAGAALRLRPVPPTAPTLRGGRPPRRGWDDGGGPGGG